MEAYTLYNLLGSRKADQIDSKYWTKLYSNDVLPGRSVDSMKQFWKNYCNVTFEDFLIESFHIKRDYALSHSQVPEDIAFSFKQKFAHAIEDWEYRLSIG